MKNGSIAFQKALEVFNLDQDNSEKYFYEAYKSGAPEFENNYIGMLQLASFFRKNSKYELAVKFYKKALEFDLSSYDQVLSANTFSKLGLSLFLINNFDEAIYYCKKSLSIINDQPHDPLICESSIVIGASLSKKAEKDKDKISEEEAIGLMKKGIDKLIPARILLEELIAENKANFIPQKKAFYDYLDSMLNVAMIEIALLNKKPFLQKYIKNKTDSLKCQEELDCENIKKTFSGSELYQLGLKEIKSSDTIDSKVIAARYFIAALEAGSDDFITDFFGWSTMGEYYFNTKDYLKAKISFQNVLSKNLQMHPEIKANALIFLCHIGLIEDNLEDVYKHSSSALSMKYTKDEHTCYAQYYYSRSKSLLSLNKWEDGELDDREVNKILKDTLLIYKKSLKLSKKLQHINDTHFSALIKDINDDISNLKKFISSTKKKWFYKILKQILLKIS